MASSLTRDRILVLIQSRESETVSGLAAEFGLAPATIRRHLDILQRDGLVTFTEVRRGTGRPEFSFSLTERGHETLPRHYSHMLGQLISTLASLGPESLQKRSGKQLLDDVLETIARESVDKRDAVGAGVASLIDMLRDQDFAPEVSEHEGGVAISLMNCPFRSVAMRNPQLCTYDTAVIANVIAAPIERVACLTEGDPFCKYLIVDRPGKNAPAAR